MTTLRSLLTSEKPDAAAPHLDRVTPVAAMPGGEVEVQGRHLEPQGAHVPRATIGDVSAPVILSRSTRATIRVPEGSITGDLILHRNAVDSNPLNLRVAVPMAENLHPVANPAVDADGNVYATVSGARGQAVPVSVFQIQRDFQIRPFVRELLNATGLAFDPEGYLYASSRAEGTVYRISPEGAMSTYAGGMGIATGIAFDRDGNLFVGDRSGTIFKIGRANPDGTSGEIFVYATLEPSIAAYHLAFNDAGTLFVTGPTTSSNQSIHAIDRDGNTTVFYQGLGRAQGMAFDVDDNLYVAASLRGQRGIIRITPHREATLAVSGNNLVGLAFLEEGNAALATRDALYHVALDIEGRRLF
jgi:sugar lactone lactonase YvrE